MRYWSKPTVRSNDRSFGHGNTMILYKTGRIRLSAKKCNEMRRIRDELEALDAPTCPRCGSAQIRRYRQFFKNGTRYHLRVDCAKCGRYIRFEPHLSR